jgi:hypothetical protein
MTPIQLMFIFLVCAKTTQSVDLDAGRYLICNHVDYEIHRTLSIIEINELLNMQTPVFFKTVDLESQRIINILK